MGRKIHRLSARTIATARARGYYADGAGLYLQVSASGSKSWIFRYMLNGRAREMGLGSETVIGLAEARQRALDARKCLHDDKDPIEVRNAHRVQEALERANSISFRDCATRYVAAHRVKWQNPKHVAQWANTLETYCGPVFGNLPVAHVSDALVLKVLEPIWTDKHETASRLRQRIEAVLDWARVRGYRTGDNPARLKGHLDKLLPTLRKTDRVRHHPAMPYEQIGKFVAELRKQEGVAALALEFTILTVARTSEVIGAKPSEFDLGKALWTIPAVRMKSRREHRVPLSPRSVAIVRARLLPQAVYLFPGQKEGQPLSNMAMLVLLERMGRGDFTVHGFRSTFRDWAAEQTNYPREVAEMALAHVIGDKTEAAYRRGDLFEKRRLLMLDWTKQCVRTRQARKSA